MNNKIQFELGLNQIDKIMELGIEKYECNQLKVICYNSSIPYIKFWLEKYEQIKKIEMIINEDKLNKGRYTHEQFKEIDKKIEIKGVKESEFIIHSKIYRFLKDDEIRFIAIGSPNFTRDSNKSIESLIFIFDEELIKNIDETIENFDWRTRGLGEEEMLLTGIISRGLRKIKIYPPITVPDMPDKYLEGLWPHQKYVLEEINGTRNAIVNIPPGTGKTRISKRFIKFMMDIEDSAVIVTVPKKKLIEQWKEELKIEEIDVVEDENDFMGSPKKKAFVALDNWWGADRNFEDGSKFDAMLEYLLQSKPLSLVIVLDECHHMYTKLRRFKEFINKLEEHEINFRIVGLSATLYSIPKSELKGKNLSELEYLQPVHDFIDLLGGESCKTEIDIIRFYKDWNNKTGQYNVDGKIIPVLKKIEYFPIKHHLTTGEQKEYEEERKKAKKSAFTTRDDGSKGIGSVILANKMKSLPSAHKVLTKYVLDNLDKFTNSFTLIFVHTDTLAKDLQKSISNHRITQDKGIAVHVYSSSVEEEWLLKYFEKDFKENKGNILISIRMLSEGYDYPKIDQVILSGSDKSPRDWIQKIGRALRIDRDPKIKDIQIAEIHDLILCNAYSSGGAVLDLDKSRVKEMEELAGM